MVSQLLDPAGSHWPPFHRFQTGHLHQSEQSLKESYTLPYLLGLESEMLTGLLADLQADTKNMLVSETKPHSISTCMLPCSKIKAMLGIECLTHQ